MASRPLSHDSGYRLVADRSVKNETNLEIHKKQITKLEATISKLHVDLRTQVHLTPTQVHVQRAESKAPNELLLRGTRTSEAHHNQSASQSDKIEDPKPSNEIMDLKAEIGVLQEKCKSLQRDNVALNDGNTKLAREQAEHGRQLQMVLQVQEKEAQAKKRTHAININAHIYKNLIKHMNIVFKVAQEDDMSDICGFEELDTTEWALFLEKTESTLYQLKVVDEEYAIWETYRTCTVPPVCLNPEACTMLESECSHDDCSNKDKIFEFISESGLFKRSQKLRIERCLDACDYFAQSVVANIL